MYVRNLPYWWVTLNGELILRCLHCLVNALSITLSKDESGLNLVQLLTFLLFNF